MIRDILYCVFFYFLFFTSMIRDIFYIVCFVYIFYFTLCTFYFFYSIYVATYCSLLYCVPSVYLFFEYVVKISKSLSYFTLKADVQSNLFRPSRFCVLLHIFTLLLFFTRKRHYFSVILFFPFFLLLLQKHFAYTTTSC